jgi:hypothetical protein
MPKEGTVIPIALIMAVILAGCAGPQERRALDVYSRGEIDALNAQKACLNLARTIVQAMRCNVR